MKNSQKVTLRTFALLGQIRIQTGKTALDNVGNPKARQLYSYSKRVVS